MGFEICSMHFVEIGKRVKMNICSVRSALIQQRTDVESGLKNNTNTTSSKGRNPGHKHSTGRMKRSLEEKVARETWRTDRRKCGCVRGGVGFAVVPNYALSRWHLMSDLAQSCLQQH